MDRTAEAVADAIRAELAEHRERAERLGVNLGRGRGLARRLLLDEDLRDAVWAERETTLIDALNLARAVHAGTHGRDYPGIGPAGE